MNVLRILGEDPSKEDVQNLIEEVDENQNGDLTLNEFLNIFSRVKFAQELDIAEAESEELSEIRSQRNLVEQGAALVESEIRKKQRKKRRVHHISAVSFYGVGALMRWVALDGDRYGGDVTGENVPILRRQARLAVLSKPLELIFYLCICISAVNSGLMTYPSMEDGPVVQALGHFTNVMFLIETVLKLVADSGSCKHLVAFLSDPWNSFDVFVLIALIVLSPVAGGDNNTGTGALRIVRILRLLRALRILRAAKVFPQLVRPPQTCLAC